MINITNKEKCCGCHACYNTCPKHCITMIKDEEGFLYPLVKQESCINCGLCEKACPMLAKEINTYPIEAYAAQSKNEGTLFNSSSGGIFSELALKIISKGGVVFGAVFSSDYKEVYHIAISDCTELSKLRTSKYVQSRIGELYQTIKKLLEAGTEVLFSGVPCQISGLKKYLSNEYENLICIDVICHGVPSPELWKRYLFSLEQTYQGNIINVNFRRKQYGWNDYGINKVSDVLEIFTSKSIDPYMQMFLRNYSLRPSCYSCQTKINGSYADITLGDFWGIENVAPEMGDERGASVVVINTKKGHKIFNEIFNSIKAKKVAYEEVRKYNSSLYKSVLKPHERDAFFADMNELAFDKLASKYCALKQKSFKQKFTETKLWKIAHKIKTRKNVLRNKFEYGIYIEIKGTSK